MDLNGSNCNRKKSWKQMKSAKTENNNLLRFVLVVQGGAHGSGGGFVNRAMKILYIRRSRSSLSLHSSVLIACTLRITHSLCAVQCLCACAQQTKIRHSLFAHKTEINFRETKKKAGQRGGEMEEKERDGRRAIQWDEHLTPCECIKHKTYTTINENESAAHSK